MANRIAGLQALDARLGGLERHLPRPRRELQLVDQGPCCEAADAIVGSADGGCSCCTPAMAWPTRAPISEVQYASSLRDGSNVRSTDNKRPLRHRNQAAPTRTTRTVRR
jgi:hypothetical protein